MSQVLFIRDVLKEAQQDGWAIRSVRCMEEGIHLIRPSKTPEGLPLGMALDEIDSVEASVVGLQRGDEFASIGVVFDHAPPDHALSEWSEVLEPSIARARWRWP